MNVDYLQILQMIKNGKSPETIVLSLFEDQLKETNPLASNLIDLAKQNRSDEIEKVARNLCEQRGIDFDKEFNNFKNNLFKVIKP